MPGAGIDQGVRFAGAQFAAWRKKKGVSQRQLMTEKVISHSALRAFEKGEAWPREQTRAKLEGRLGLPAGQIDDWRYQDGAPARPASAIPASIDVIASALEAAVQSQTSAAQNLPAPDDPRYWETAVERLQDLHKLDATVVAASRVAPTEAVLTQLRNVRQTYDHLIRALAAARPDQYGPQLYLARTSTQMSIAEAAEAAGVAPGMIAAVESCQVEATPEVRALLEHLGGAA